jgi:predicted nuclease of predicted toxin-antitoxin system
MNLYLDDDSANTILAAVLRKARHDVRLPATVGLAGAKDPVHLTRAIAEHRILLTRNYDDFEALHLLIMQAQGHHPGILLIRRDNDPRRNMAPRDIVRALRNLEAAGLPLADHCYELNPWQ